MLWHLLESMFNCCELEDSLPGLIVQKWKLSMLAESTCESFKRTVLPFVLDARGTEAFCYFQCQDFRLTQSHSGCMQGRRSFQKGELKTRQVCLRLVKSQFRKSKTLRKPDMF